MKSRNPPGLRATVVRCRPLAKIATWASFAILRVNCSPSMRVQVTFLNIVLTSQAAGTGVCPVRKHREWTVCG